MNGISLNKILGGILLVAGTCIGAGMLALPISTGPAGFYTSMFAFIFCWFAMILSALLMVEVSLWFPRDTNLMTMAKTTLGKTGAMLAFIIYILFFYALMAAYTIAASGIITKFLHLKQIDESYAIWIVAGLFALVVYLGARAVDIANRILMIGLILGYLVLVTLVLPKIDMALLNQGQSQFIWAVGSLLVTSFGFHLLIPSLKDYLDGNARALRWSVIIGSFIPLVIYLFWEIVILGVIPIYGSDSIFSIIQAETQQNKHSIVELITILGSKLQNPYVQLSADLFCLSAILTSFIGVALALFDFFADSFHIHKNFKGKFLLALLTFLAPVLIALYYPSFINTLHYAGFFAAILLILYPASMAWAGRYHLKMNSAYQCGGRKLIIAMMIFGFTVVILEILDRTHQLPSVMNESKLFD